MTSHRISITQTHTLGERSHRMSRNKVWLLWMMAVCACILDIEAQMWLQNWTSTGWVRGKCVKQPPSNHLVVQVRQWLHWRLRISTLCPLGARDHQMQKYDPESCSKFIASNVCVECGAYGFAYSQLVTKGCDCASIFYGPCSGVVYWVRDFTTE